MLSVDDKQSSFYDADYICEQLIPDGSFYRKFKEIVSPLVSDDQFETLYCTDNGRPAIPRSLLAIAFSAAIELVCADRIAPGFDPSMTKFMLT